MFWIEDENDIQPLNIISSDDRSFGLRAMNHTLHCENYLLPSIFTSDYFFDKKFQITKTAVFSRQVWKDTMHILLHWVILQE